MLDVSPPVRLVCIGVFAADLAANLALGLKAWRGRDRASRPRPRRL
ncbi:MAG: hypothetical protein ACR2KV_16030 [Solirubrobacteraceae bacterium]